MPSYFTLPILVVLLSSMARVSTSYQCELPKEFSIYSVISKEDASIGAHSMYKGVAVGGTLSDGTPDSSATFDRTTSRVKALANPNRFNFNGGIETGVSLETSVDFGHFEWLAGAAKSGDFEGGKKVVVLTKGGTYNLYDFRNGGQGEDNGNTIVIFNTSDDVILTKTHDGRQFGPSVIAPFSKVIVLGNAGFVDGTIVGKQVVTSGGNQGQLQLHGDNYNGPFVCGVNPGSGGDPHFKTWLGRRYDFHHQCDLLLVKSESFMEGKGLEVQIRTTSKSSFSYISGVAVRIGRDVLEISQTEHFYNGSQDYDLTKARIGGYSVEITYSLKSSTSFVRNYVIEISPSFIIVVIVRKNLMEVRFHGADENLIGDSVGMLGEYRNGTLLSRSGIEIEDLSEFGNEWQVNYADSALFSSAQSPQFPQKCTPPAPVDQARYLRHGISLAQAEKACEGWGEEMDDCVFDVMATGDIDVASAF
jgi:hypothetical protein